VTGYVCVCVCVCVCGCSMRGGGDLFKLKIDIPHIYVHLRGEYIDLVIHIVTILAAVAGLLV